MASRIPTAQPALGKSLANQSDGPIFPQLFPQPTGRNGWELVVRAADLLATAPLAKFEEVSADGLDKEAARRALALPGMRSVAELVLEAGRMPFVSPRKQMDFSTVFPDLAAWRRVARWVSLALFDHAVSGRSRDATQLAEAGIRIARAVASEALIGTLVSIACEAVIWRRLVDIAPMLADSDLDRLGTGLLAAANDRSRFASGMQIESTAMLSIVERQFNAADPTGLDEDDAQSRATVEILRDPGRLARIRSEFSDLVRQRLERDLNALKNPLGWRPSSKPPLAGDLALLEGLLPKPSLVISRALAASTELRLAGLYLRCWAYRRRRLRWPSKLSDIAPAAETLELVSSRPIGYERPDGLDTIRLTATALPSVDGEVPRGLSVPVARPAGTSSS
jgi:hypothetical protein